MKRVTTVAIMMVFNFHPTARASQENLGQEVYNQCIGCHSFHYNRTGPKHCGLFGRLAGSVAGYDYSAAMRQSNIVWNADTLDTFLASTLSVVQGTTMGFTGISNAKKRQQLIAYLQHQSQSKECAQ